jgi:hypothetical protein
VVDLASQADAAVVLRINLSAGPIGLLLIQLLRAAGVSRIVTAERWRTGARRPSSRRSRSAPRNPLTVVQRPVHSWLYPKEATTMLRLRRGSGYEQAEAELCLVEADEVAVALGPLA